MSTVTEDDRSRRERQFPVSARAQLAATPATTRRWFVTVHSTQSDLVGGYWVERPTSLVHAKRMGSTTTACGRPASSWRKLYHLSFQAGSPDACPQCAAQVPRG